MQAVAVVEAARVVWEAVLERCCGLDVHKQTVTACLLIGALDQQPRESLRTFPTTTKGLLELRDWLEENGCTHVAIESTGIYWRPVFHILEDAVTVFLVNAYHMKQIPGRKTDLKDAQWISRLLRWGLLKPSLIPPKPIRDVRDLCCYRKKLTEQASAEKNRIQKVLEDANIKLASVASDVFGLSGRAMLDALLAADMSAEEMAELARGKMRSKIPQLVDALEGRISEHHRFLIRMHLEHLEYLKQAIAQLYSDNGSEFINQHLFAYCQREKITFTRSRSYKKNDSCHVEQKNWSVVRRLVGYDRYTSRAALEGLNRTYDLLRLYVNFFQPVMKLLAKTRHGARVYRVYDKAQTPYQRLLRSGVLTEAKKQELAATYRHLNPILLLKQINGNLESLWRLADRPTPEHMKVAKTYKVSVT